MDIVIATNNINKVKEYNEILSPLGFNCLSLKELNIICDPEETGSTFKENALIKAKEIAKYTNRVILADDSGMEVDAYPNLLGIYSHRFLENEPYSIKNATLIEMLKNKIKTARYVCAIALINFNDQELFFEGICEGHISDIPKGNNGFGYDPIFIPSGLDKTMAELESEEKHKISHRGIASNKLVEYLKGIK